MNGYRFQSGDPVACAWCRQVQIDDEWLDGDEAERRVGHALPQRELSHGICPRCARRVWAELGVEPPDDGARR